MPRDSATVLATGGEAADWDQRAELLASVVDELRLTRWLMLRLHATDYNEPAPERLRRPGETPEIETVSLADAASMFLGV